MVQNIHGIGPAMMQNIHGIGPAMVQNIHGIGPAMVQNIHGIGPAMARHVTMARIITALHLRTRHRTSPGMLNIREVKFHVNV